MKKKMKKEIKFSQLEKRLLYNFVVGERNRIQYSIIDSLNARQDNLDVEIRIKPNRLNLNNFNGDTKKYEKVLDKLIEALKDEK